MPLLRRQPIIQSQAGNVLEVLSIVSDQREVVDESRRGNLHVQGVNWATEIEKRRMHSAKLVRALAIEGQFHDVRQKSSAIAFNVGAGSGRLYAQV